jgi:signal transduction histidine kinase
MMPATPHFHPPGRHPVVAMGMACALTIGLGEPAVADWDERLAATFSARLRDIDREREAAIARLAELPAIPVDNQGGTGGFAAMHHKTTPPDGDVFAVEIRWPSAAGGSPDVPLVDFVALVPARRYDARGLDAHFGMPDDFTVELIAADGTVVDVIASERAARGHPVRAGHPFVYRLSRPVAAAGLRISASRLAPDVESSDSHVHAWAEVFAFSGPRNLSHGGNVRLIGGAPSPARWLWDPEFLVDGQTPLGLPELPLPELLNVGWISNARNDPGETATLAVDLGETAAIDGLRLLPVRRLTSDLPSGFGFPRRIEVWTSGLENPPRTGNDGWSQVMDVELVNPGHNPVWLSFGEAVDARHVKVVAAELWKEFDGYPAFFALSELEVLGNMENLALGRIVRTTDGMLNMMGPGGKYWSAAALSNGHGPDGRLVSTREWLEKLGERLTLELLIHELDAEGTRLVNGWRTGALATFALCAFAGIIALVALPIRYRMRNTRELLAVRERIAGDLHDEVGSNLGSIQMFADLAEGRSGPSDELKRIQRIAAETVSAVRDIVWLLRPGRDHRIGTIEHLRETSSIMLESLKWKFSANEPSWNLELPEDVNRHLFLYFREALHNIMRHANAANVTIQAETNDHRIRLEIHDDGCGIPAEKIDRPATLRALRQRAGALAATFAVDSRPDHGTTLTLDIPLQRKRPHRNPATPATP